MAKKSTKTSTTKLTPAGTLTKLRAAYRRMTANNAENRGTYGSMVKEAEETKHLHKKALATALKEDKMEPPELRAYYEHLEHYRKELGLEDRAASAPELPMAEEGEEEGQEAENVHHLPTTVQ
jgi:hypothetical protein